MINKQSIVIQKDDIAIIKIVNKNIRYYRTKLINGRLLFKEPISKKEKEQIERVWGLK